jgi:hypothetical protein
MNRRLTVRKTPTINNRGISRYGPQTKPSSALTRLVNVSMTHLLPSIKPDVVYDTDFGTGQGRSE